MAHAHLSRLVRTLRQSELFADDFPKRKRFTHAEWAALDEDRWSKYYEPGLIAIRRVKDVFDLAGIVDQLGDAKYAAAVPLLTELWTDCALDPVRNAAGHALRTIGTSKARQALLALIEDSDHLSVYLAVAAVFDEDPLAAFEFFLKYFEPSRVNQPGGAVIPSNVLGVFAPGSFLCGRNGEMIPQWSHPKAPNWFRRDSRWVRLCVKLRHDKRLGDTARNVLRHAKPELVKPVLAEALHREGPRVIHPTTTATGDLLARYRRGEFVAVWNELRGYESLGGELLKEAQAVANETMRRVAHNADLLAERLADSGWKPLYGKLRSKPRASDKKVMLQTEEITGAPLPVSLRAFWEVVGGINFVWDYEKGEAPNLSVEVSLDGMDPLCIDPPEAVSQLFDEWEYQRKGVDPELTDPFKVDLAPDYLHKVNVSGGAPYGIELPFHGVDPVFANEAHELPFVDYLRLCFRWAGFPRLEREAKRKDVRDFLKSMCKDLEPF